MTRLISEAQFQNTVIEIFRAHGCPVFHIGDSRREIRRRDGTRLLVGDHRARGYPDLTIAGTPDEVIWAELKAEGKYPTPEQREWLDRLPPHRAYVWRPRGPGRGGTGGPTWPSPRRKNLLDLPEGRKETTKMTRETTLMRGFIRRGGYLRMTDRYAV